MPVVVILAIALLVLGAAAAVFAIQRNRDATRAVGYLARETRSRDAARARRDAPAAEADAADEPAPSSGKDVELATVAEREKALAPAGPSAPAPWVPPDEEQMGVTRRQFMNRGIVAGFALGPRRLTLSA